MAVERVVIETDLGIEADQLSVLGDDQRIDLQEGHVLLGEGFVEAGQQAAHLLLLVGIEPERLGDAPHMVRTDVRHRVDRDRHDPVGRVMGHLLDVHAALGGDDHRDARGGAIDQHRQVELLVDGRALLDVEPVDLLALGPGLVRDQRGAEQARGLLLHIVDGLDHLDAAGLAAATGVDLGLHDPDRAAELFGGLDGLLDAERRQALGDRHAERAQNLLGLIFVDIHAVPLPVPRYLLPRSGAIFWQASTRPLTALADLSNISRSAPDNSSSTMRSAPLAPITTGTPT